MTKKSSTGRGAEDDNADLKNFDDFDPTRGLGGGGDGGDVGGGDGGDVGGGGEEDGGEEPSGDLEAARAELEDKLLLSVQNQAMAAESGTDNQSFENIVGVGISEKLVDGVETGEKCVTVYVVAKAPRRDVAQEAFVPSDVAGVPTDVVAIGELWAQPYRGRYRPAPGGVSVGHYKITAGTLGCLVRQGSKLCILSNNHVLANSNDARPGDAVLQPGRIDGGVNPRDVIAQLTQFIPINFRGGANLVDAAIAQTNPRLCIARNISYGPIGRTPVPPRLNMLVKKAGRTTQFTRGLVRDVNATVRVNYGVGIALFQRQIIVRSTTSNPFSQGGDSGSVIVTDTPAKSPVGLLFAGSATHTIANPIAAVLSALRISIVG